MGLEIRLLGPFEVCLDGKPVDGFKTAKERALLAYLAAEVGRPHQRDRLAGLLWPGWPQRAAMSNLRSALAALRKVIGDREADPPFLTITRQTIQLNPDGECWVDVVAFDADGRPPADDRDPGTTVSQLRSAVGHYRGDFLEGFTLSDSPDFEGWVLSNRQHYRQQALEALGELAQGCEQSGDHNQGLEYARRQLALEPWLEEAHRQVMRLLVLSGRRSEALAQFETCRKALKSELNAEPAVETVMLVEQIRSGAFGAEIQDASDPGIQSEIKHNLPLELTSFIGRENEVARIQELLSQHRLVTLTGVGGTGKTRLSLHVAGLVLANYPNGAWLVELAGLSDPALVPRTVASVLNLPEIAGKPVTDSLVDFLQEKRLLLILDNCEHLLEACIDLADRLLRACPNLTILASSREFLGVAGEVPYRLPPMALPDSHRGAAAELLSAYDAVKLFTARARMVAPDFAVTVDNAAAVVQVVNRLDGIPLAIELAAARLRLLSVEQLARRLDDTFRLLTGGSRSRLPRHQTLRASIDWSYNLLSEKERVLLRRLSVFAGDWRLDAAERVCADPPGPAGVIPPEDVLDLVNGLLDKSLVQTIRTREGINRFRVLETLRQYAHEKLVGEGESQSARDRHLAYYQGWVDETAPKIRGREQIQTLDLVEREVDNLRLALEWALQTEIEAELKIAVSLVWFWHIHVRESEAIEWLERGLKIAEMDQGQESIDTEPRTSEIAPLVRAWAMAVLGFFRWLQLWMVTSQVDYAPEQAKNLLEDAIHIFQTLDPDRNQDAKLGLAWANVWLSHYLDDFEDDRDRARSMTQDALDTFRAAGDLLGTADCLQFLAYLSSSPEHRIQLHQEQLAIHEELGDPHGIGNAYMFIGWAADIKGDYNAAVKSFKAALKYAQQVNDPNTVHNARLMIGINLHFMADLADAETYIQRALAGFREIGIQNRTLWCLEAKSKLRLAQGRYDLAAELNDQAWEIAQRSGIDVLFAIALTMRSRLARLQGDLDQALHDLDALPPLQDMPYFHKILIPLEWGELALQNGDLAQSGRWFREASMVLHTASYIYIPPFMDGTARHAARTGRSESAARLFGSRWCRGYVHFLSPVEKEWRESDWAALRDGLGDERFRELYEEGKSMTYEQFLALAQEVLHA